jgi:alkaline phosphatase D
VADEVVGRAAEAHRPQSPCAVGRDHLRADLRYVERVGPAGAPVETFAGFVVEDGRPGAVPA